MNLLDELHNHVSTSLAEQASDFLEESRDNVAKGLDTIFPILLKSVLDKSKEPQGSKILMDSIGGLDIDAIEDLGSVFGGGTKSVRELLESGSAISKILLGVKTEKIIRIVSNVSGLKSGSSLNLIRIAAPILMGRIGNQIKGKGMSFFEDFMLAQEGSINSVLPTEKSEYSNLNNGSNKDLKSDNTHSEHLESNGEHLSEIDHDDSVSEHDMNQQNQTKNSGHSLGWLKWILPLVVVGLLTTLGVMSDWFGTKYEDRNASTDKKEVKTIPDSIKTKE